MAEEDESLVDVNQSKSGRWRELVAVLVACIAPLTGGMAHGYSSPAIPELEKPTAEGGLDLNSSQVSWFAASMTIGAVVGGPIASLILDRLGRKFSLMATSLPLTVGWLFIISATTDTIWLLNIGRAFTGIGTGMGTAIAPVYIAEVASPELRGLLGSFFQACLFLGVLFSFLLGVGLTYVWLAICASLVAFALSVLMLFIPETPRWLISIGDRNQATHSVTWLRNYGDNIQQAQCDVNALVTDMNAEQSEPFKLKDFIYDKRIRKAMILSMLLMIFQQFGGINGLAFYLESILMTAGFGSFSGVMTVLLAVILVVGSFSSSFFLDRFGRKKMLIFSGIVVCISCIVFGGYFILIQKKLVNTSKWYIKAIALVSLSCYAAGFAVGWGPAPWVVMSELLPNKARGTGSSIATATNWTCAFIVVKGFHFLQETISISGTFFLFAVISFVAIFFTKFFIPETKRKSLEVIERELGGESESPQAPDAREETDKN